MEFQYTDNSIEIHDKKLLNLDKFVLDFTSILIEKNINFVIVSGYIPILFGRNRTSEDVDLLVEKMGYEAFKKLWDALQKTYDCVITEDSWDAYDNYLLNQTAIRFAKKASFIPNIEFKFPKLGVDFWTLKQRIKVRIDDHDLFISPLEIQIPYKLFLGSEKDIEDAKFLYNIFKDHLDRALFDEFNQKFKTQSLFVQYIK